MPTLTIKDIREAYYVHSGKASDIIRQLGLAGVALIWVFKIDKGGGQWQVPQEFIKPAALIIVALGLDFLQYLVATALWFTVLLVKHKKGREESDLVDCPSWINVSAILFFWGKALVLAWAYLLIIDHLFRKLH